MPLVRFQIGFSSHCELLGTLVSNGASSSTAVVKRGVIFRQTLQIHTSQVKPKRKSKYHVFQMGAHKHRARERNTAGLGNKRALE